MPELLHMPFGDEPKDASVLDDTPKQTADLTQIPIPVEIFADPVRAPEPTVVAESAILKPKDPSNKPPEVPAAYISDRWREPQNKPDKPTPLLRAGETITIPPKSPEQLVPPSEVAQASAEEIGRALEVAKVLELVLKYGAHIEAKTLREKLGLPITATDAQIKQAGLRAVVDLTPTFKYLIKPEKKILVVDEVETAKNPLKPDGTREQVVREVYENHQATPQEIADNQSYELIKAIARIMENAFEQYTRRGEYRETKETRQKRSLMEFTTEMVTRKNEDTLANIIRAVDTRVSTIPDLKNDFAILIRMREAINKGLPVTALLGEIKNPGLKVTLETVVPNTEAKRRKILEADKQAFESKVKATKSYVELVTTLKNQAARETGRGTAQQYLDALVSLKTDMDAADEVEINTMYSTEHNSARLSATLLSPELVTHFSDMIDSLREQMLRDKEGQSAQKIEKQAVNMMAGITDITRVLEILLSFKDVSKNLNTMRVMLDRAKREAETYGEAAFKEIPTAEQAGFTISKADEVLERIAPENLKSEARRVFDIFLKKKIESWS